MKQRIVNIIKDFGQSEIWIEMNIWKIIYFLTADKDADMVMIIAVMHST